MEVRAERAEANAAATVEFAYAALEEAEYQVLNAALARLDVEDAGAATSSHDPSCTYRLGYGLTTSELGRIEGELLAAT